MSAKRSEANQPMPLLGCVYCPKCKSKMLPGYDGEWFTCPNRCVIDAAAEDCAMMYAAVKP